MNKQAGVWVRCSERLPVGTAKAVNKFTGEVGELTIHKKRAVFTGQFSDNIYQYEFHNKNLFENIIWLDEQPIHVNQDEILNHKFYVMQDSEGGFSVWTKEEYEYYIGRAVGVGAGSAFKIVIGFNGNESYLFPEQLKSSPSPTLVQDFWKDLFYRLEAIVIRLRNMNTNAIATNTYQNVLDEIKQLRSSSAFPGTAKMDEDEFADWEQVNCGIGAAIAVFNECQITVPEDHPDPTAINDCISMTRDAQILFNKLKKKYLESTPVQEGLREIDYNANFLWGFPDDSIEAMGYEFANAKTEAYQKECWNSLIEKLTHQIEGLREADKIRKEHGAYIWAFPIKYRNEAGLVYQEDYGWEIEFEDGKVKSYGYSGEPTVPNYESALLQAIEYFYKQSTKREDEKEK